VAWANRKCWAQLLGLLDRITFNEKIIEGGKS